MHLLFLYLLSYMCIQVRYLTVTVMYAHNTILFVCKLFQPHKQHLTSRLIDLIDIPNWYLDNWTDKWICLNFQATHNYELQLKHVIANNSLHIICYARKIKKVLGRDLSSYVSRVTMVSIEATVAPEFITRSLFD